MLPVSRSAIWVATMQHVSGAATTSEPAGQQPVAASPEVTIRYWAAARAAAGAAEEQVHGSTLAEVLAAARETRAESDRFSKVLTVCSFLVGDTPVGTRDPADVPLAAGDVVEVLPPFAGG